MSEAVNLSTLEGLAHTTSVIGKGGAYVALCALLSVNCLVQRARAGRPLLSPKLSGLEQMTWLLWSYWVFGTLLNQALKFSLGQPRPWWLDPSAPPLSPHPSMGFGMPSGHSQGAVGLWLLAYLVLKGVKAQQWSVPRPALALLSLCCALWVPLTMWARVTVHAHSVAQVWAGMSLGLIWAIALLWTAERAKEPVASLVFSALVALCLGVLLYHYSAPLDVPDAWLITIRAHVSEPLWLKPKLKVLGALAVASAGLIWVWWRRPIPKSVETHSSP